MRKLAAILILGLACIGLEAQESGQLYAQVAAATVYLKHEVFMDPSLCKNVALFERWEETWKTKFLSSYFALSSGSGFLVDGEGLVLTNRHVARVADLAELRSQAANAMAQAVEQYSSKAFTVEEIKRIKLDLYSMITKGTYRFGAVVGEKIFPGVATVAIAGESEPDIAVLKIQGGFGPGLALADSSALTAKLIGTEVFSFGFPLGANMEERFGDLVVTMNKGTISAIRNADLGVQHSAAISHGNSGGPLVDASGTVLGMNSASIEEGNSLFLAVGADRIRAFLAKKGIPIAASRPADPRPDPAIPKISASPAAIAAPIALSPPAEGEAPRGPGTAPEGIEVASRVYVGSASGAEVFINGRRVGVSPMTITVLDGITKVALRGEEGSYSATLRLNRALSGTTVLKAELHACGEVFVTAADAAARVLLDGSDLGALGSGEFRDVPVGDHRLELAGRNSYFSQAVAVVADAPARIQANLRPVGSLEIKVPAGVQTAISGGSYNATIIGAASLAHIPVGDYCLKSSGGDYPAYTTTFSLKQGVLATWEPYVLGIVAFSVTPAGSLCSFGAGTPLGTDAEAGGLVPGSYTAVIRHPGYKDQEVSFNVMAGKRTLVSASLSELGRGSIALPRLGSPLELKVKDAMIAGKDGPEGTVLYEGIPSGLPVTVSFVSPAAQTTGIPDQVVTLNEGETRKLEIPSGHIALPWLPSGALVEVGSEARFELKNEADSGFISSALSPGSYLLMIHGGPKGTDCSMTATVLPNASREPEGYRSAMLGNLGFEKSAEGKELSKRRMKTGFGIASLVTGVLGAGGAVACYFLGSQAMDSYRAAPDTANASSRWGAVSLWQDLFGVSAGVGGLGFALSPILLTGGPDLKVLQRSIDAIDEGIRELGK